jgi:hypothetical protein
MSSHELISLIFSEPYYITIILLGMFTIVPLLVYLQIFLYRFFKMRQIAKQAGKPRFRPSMVLLALYLWLILNLFSILLFCLLQAYLSRWHRHAEAKLDLGSIYSCQMSYFAEHGVYAGRNGENGSGAFADIGWKPEAQTIYAYYVGGDYLAPTEPGTEVVYKLGGNWPFSFSSESSTHGFTALAIGNIDSDPCMDVWMINDNRELANLIDDHASLENIKSATECPGIGAAEIKHYVELDRMLRFVGVLALSISLCSPALIVLIPIMYYLAIRQNRRYHEALAAISGDPPPGPRE